MKNIFPKINYQQWKQSAAKTLEGADFEEMLTTITYEGIRIKPIYSGATKISSNQQPGTYPYLRSTEQLGYKEKPWEICSKVEFNTDFNIKAKKILTDTEAALIVTFPEEFSKDDFVKLSIKDFEQAFDGIDLTKNKISFEPCIFADLVFEKFTKYCRTLNRPKDIDCTAIDYKAIDCNIEFDCFGSLLIYGGMPYDMDQYYDKIISVVKPASQIFITKTIAINSVVFNSAGANAVQELAFALATGVDIIRSLQKRGLDINQIANNIRFHFSVGSNFFMEIAKFRAARILWSKIIKEFGGDSNSQKINIHAETTTINKAIHDPHTNMLRGTGEAMAAVLGGVDSLYVHPYRTNSTVRKEFAERIARNTQRVIRDESHLIDTIDPSGGSYYIESLTAELAESAWKKFQEIEAEGGMIKAILNGIPQKQIKEVAAKRYENLHNGRDVFIGVNKFPNPNESDCSFPKKEKQEIRNTNYKTIVKALFPINLENLFNKDNK